MTFKTRSKDFGPWSLPHSIKELESGVRYQALFFDPRRGVEHALGEVKPDAAGSWRIPTPPVRQDLVLALEGSG